MFYGCVGVSRPISEHPWAARISGLVFVFLMCDDSWFRRKRDSLRYRLWRRKWSTLTESRIAEIIAEIAPKHGVKFIAFKTNASDGIVRPEDGLEVYVVNNGGLSYAGLTFLCGEMRCAMNRDADFFPMEHETERSELEELGLNIAYEESGTISRREEPEGRYDDVQGMALEEEMVDGIRRADSGDHRGDRSEVRSEVHRVQIGLSRRDHQTEGFA